jgi:hypothetical protein
MGLDINGVPSNVTIPHELEIDTSGGAWFFSSLQWFVFIVSISFSTTAASSLKYECYIFDSDDYLSLHDSDRDIRVKAMKGSRRASGSGNL